MRKPLTEMPDTARLWVYGLDRELTPAERGQVEHVLDLFVNNWESHGDPVTGAFEIIDNRILVLAGYTADGVSGCSTDSSVRVVKTLKEHFGVDGFNRTLVFYRRKGGCADAMTRDAFQEKVNAGELGPGTVVFDNTITTVGDWRAGKFETRFENSWHAKAFG